MFTYLVLGATYAFAAAVQPGPLQTYLISQTLTQGWRRALPAAFAPLLSDGPVIVLVLLVLSQVPAWLVQVLRLAGGLFLLYLAFSAAKTWRAFKSPAGAQPVSARWSLLQATFINLLNPAPYLGWSLVMGPLLLKGWQAAPINGLALLLSFYSAMIFTTVGIMALFAAARQFGPQVSRALIGLSAIGLTGFGLYQLWLAFQAFWPPH